MTDTADEVELHPARESSARSRVTRWVNRPLVAAAVLLVVYLLLSLANDPRGFLGTDTGGKIATLEVMVEDGTLDPDVGYWAERWDPEGRVHPMWYTNTFGDNWVQLSTLPVAYLGLPLYTLGGYRLALLLPMAGAVGAAFAARSLAQRMGGEGWRAFWIVGLASPMVVYALDFWEHTIGVALMGFGIVAFLDAAEQGSARRGLLGGALFGLAATIRTEAFVYVLVITAVVCVSLLLRRGRVGPSVRVGAAAVGGFVVPVVSNALLEVLALGEVMRLDLSASAASRAGGEGGTRLQEALVTSLSIHPSSEGRYYVVGLGLFALLAFVAHRARGRRDPGPAVLAAAAAVLLYLLRFADDLGFVPGLIAATPIAAVGVVLGWSSRPSRLAVGAALGALPLVWLFQFSGGAGPQWAGRYILVTGFVLLVAGVTALPQLHRWASTLFLVLSVAVTLFGVAWLSQRSHEVAEAHEALAAREEPVLVSDVAHLAREGGAFYRDKRWLTAVYEGDLEYAVDVVERAGFGVLGFVELDGDDAPPELDGWDQAETEGVEFISGVPLRVTTYELVGS